MQPLERALFPESPDLDKAASDGEPSPLSGLESIIDGLAACKYLGGGFGGYALLLFNTTDARNSAVATKKLNRKWSLGKAAKGVSSPQSCRITGWRRVRQTSKTPRETAAAHELEIKLDNLK